MNTYSMKSIRNPIKSTSIGDNPEDIKKKDIYSIPANTNNCKPSASKSDNSQNSNHGNNYSYSLESKNQRPVSSRNSNETIEKKVAGSLFAADKLQTQINNVSYKIADLSSATYGTPEYQELRALSRKLSEYQAALSSLKRRQSQKETPGTTHPSVPLQIPFTFQWHTFKVDDSLPCYRSLQECFQHFENICKLHNFDLEVDGPRLLPSCLSTDLQEAFDDVIDETIGGHPSWSTIKTEIMSEYIVVDQILRDQALEKLLKLQMGSDVTLEEHIAEFKKLATIAQYSDNEEYGYSFFTSLKSELFKEVGIPLNTEERRDFNKVVDTARKVNPLFYLERSMLENQDEQLVKVPRPRGNNFVVSSGGHYYEVRPWCQHHPRSTAHATKDCLLNQTQEAAIKLRCKNHPKAIGHDTKDCSLNQNNQVKKNHTRRTRRRKCELPSHIGLRCRCPYKARGQRASAVPTKTTREESEESSDGDESMDSCNSDFSG